MDWSDLGGVIMAGKSSSKSKRPTKEELSKAGKALQNPHTREKKETEAAKTLEKGRKKK